ncbi:suppressor of fused domain protein [Tenacibaculum sp. 190524A05c]|uniref:suppressor of fused domain protein n=1 Tax=Tenacibaculum platacis TaxID=3137852 RepID=UPI0032B208B5
MNQDIFDYFANKEYFDDHDDWISEHLDKYFQSEEISVFHEFIAFDFKVHIYFIQPKKYSFNILLSSGMSSLKMNVPDEVENKKELEFSELMMLIPKDITFSEVYTGESKNDYLISMLKHSAKFPHFNETWMGIGHTICADENYGPYSNETNFVGGVLLPSVTFDEDFTKIKREGTIINLYTFFPLFKNEIKYKIKNGYSALFDLLIKSNMKETFDNNRNNLIPKKSFWNRLKL